ncbi:MAG: primosomal protein N' [Bacteroidetes bacterium]|nr:primosomal protein N' [Bacteroidota bacterium]
MDRITLFADVVLPIPLAGTFVYRVPFELNDEVKVGQRVVVQFGRQKVYTALVWKIHQIVPQSYEVKYVLSILDEKPIINEKQMQLWEWMAQYYMCTLGEVMNAALPSSLKLASESKIVLNPNFNYDFSQLNEKEYLIAEALDLRKVITLTECSDIVEQKKIIPLIKTLIEKGVILLQEELINQYKPKKETFVSLADKYINDEPALKKIFDSLEKKSFKQLQLLISYISLTNINSESYQEISKSILLKSVDSNSTVLDALVKKGVFETCEKEVSRLEIYEKPVKESMELNEFQVKALDEIKDSFKEKDVVLLHGITSSGKTEIYVKLIEEAISQGKQVLYLLPEIALTTQIINRLRRYFGNNVGVYHSKFNENERVEIWNSVLNKPEDLVSRKYQIVLGARSAMFLPFENLGIVIVDEEHETSYKQYDPAPRYNARDAAIYLAHLHQCKTLLGSATPSIETFFKAKTQKFGFVELSKRFGEIQLPEILVADVKDETRKKKMKSHFSSFLIEHIGEALKRKEQVILFQNRRGFSTRLECDECNWVPQCKNCDVTLTYHKFRNQLKCHYCGFSTRIVEKCPTCNSKSLSLKGFGTEKIEDEIPIFFPDATVARMDLDTTRTKHAYQQIINDFEDRKVDILIGTQMISKGLDFDNVSLVGVLNADNMLSFPDFRAFERSFQLMAQVSGRAGRKGKRGKVVIQSFNPYHSVIRYIIDNDYIGMYESQLLERRNFKYPPFVKLVSITLKHKDSDLLDRAAKEFAINLKSVLGKRVLGPEFPLVSRVRNEYLKNILIKIENEISSARVKTLIGEEINKFKAHAEFKSARIIIDVDPV